jgi:hypothetical protein
MVVRIKTWWWTIEKGEPLLNIQYCGKTLEISKCKSANDAARLAIGVFPLTND